MAKIPTRIGSRAVYVVTLMAASSFLSFALLFLRYTPTAGEESKEWKRKVVELGPLEWRMTKLFLGVPQIPLPDIGPWCEYQNCGSVSGSGRKSNLSVIAGGNGRAEPTASPAIEDAPLSSSTLSGEWSGDSGYTVVLTSVTSEASARNEQAKATATGLEVGVLLSSEYTSLRSGYWVVFSGQFQNESDAKEHRRVVVAKGYGESYVRLVRK